MEKILLVLNARKPNSISIDFACHVAKLANTKLTGLFVENHFVELIPVDIDGPSYFDTVNKIVNTTTTVDTDQSVRLFKEECQRRGVSFEVYIDRGEPIQELLFESRFADLLIVEPDIGYYNRQEAFPSHLVKEILAKAECPVLLVPEKCSDVDEIVFCYDDTASSVFAIKQFTYLFPEFRDKKAMLLEVTPTSEETFDESHRRMMNWLRVHYKNVYYHGLKGNVKDELFSYFFMKEKKWIVIGAYGRSFLSNLFKKSKAEVLIRMVDLPIFITHF